MSKILYCIAAGTLVVVFASCGKKMAETKPIRKDVTETVFASGVLEAKNTYNLTAQTDGYLRQVNFEEGDLVKAGQLLAAMDNQENRFNQASASDLFAIAQANTSYNAPALLQAQNTININKVKMEQDLVQYQRYQKLWEANSIAKIDLENMELQYKTAQANYESALENYRQLKQQATQQLISSKAQKKVNTVLVNNNQIRALVGGKVYKKYKQVGDYVKRGEVIAAIGDAGSIYAKVNIDESNIAKVKLGQPTSIQLNVNKGKLYQGTVAEINPAFDEAAQSFVCKIAFTDSLDFRITGTQLQCNITVETYKNALLIPRNYLDFGGHVMIKGQKQPTKIVTKFISNQWVQVLSGIDDNTVLVTENIQANKTTTSEVGAQMR
jgi:multidrug efflux pump subunit AcrA (membrane-fusion protein)